MPWSAGWAAAGWKNLHRLVYLAAPLAAYHQAAARKLFPVQVLWIFVPLALLEVAARDPAAQPPARQPVPALRSKPATEVDGPARPPV